MITVEQLSAALKRARNTNVLQDEDELHKSPHTGNLAIIRDGSYIGHIDLNTCEVYVPNSAKIKGLNPSLIVIDEISAFLEAKEPGRTDEDGKDVLYRHMAANEES